VPSFHGGNYHAAIEQYGLLGYIVNSVIVATADDVLFALSWPPWRPSRWPLSTGAGAVTISWCCWHFDVSADRHRRSGLAFLILVRLAQYLSRYCRRLYFAFPAFRRLGAGTTFFKEVPYEIEEAALIDGCSRLAGALLVVLPLAAPGILTAAMLVFIHAWNEFFFALIILTYPDVQTLPVGIALFPGEYTMPWGEIAAASTIATLPLMAADACFSSAASCRACRRAR
jgi:multiple sugar transport system permease protein